MPEEAAQVALEAIDAIREVLDLKRRALENRDFEENYRLARVMSILARHQENVDHRLHNFMEGE